MKFSEKAVLVTPISPSEKGPTPETCNILSHFVAFFKIPIGAPCEPTFEKRVASCNICILSELNFEPLVTPKTRSFRSAQKPHKCDTFETARQPLKSGHARHDATDALRQHSILKDGSVHPCRGAPQTPLKLMEYQTVTQATHFPVQATRWLEATVTSRSQFIFDLGCDRQRDRIFNQISHWLA